MFAFSLPVLRKEVVSWVSEAEEPALAPLGSWSWQRPPDGQSRQLACGLCELHELMPFWAQDRTEGLYSHCTCPASRSIDFCSQKPSIRVTIPLGLLPCLSPGKKSLGSHAYVMELFIFQCIYFCKILQRSETHTQPWFWVYEKWHNTIFHYFFRRYCMMSLPLPSGS